MHYHLSAMSGPSALLRRMLWPAVCRAAHKPILHSSPLSRTLAFHTSLHTTASRWYRPAALTSAQFTRCYSTAADQRPQRVNFTFVTTTGDRYEVWGFEGDSLYDVVVNRSVPLDGFGACEATLACSTCHCIFTEEVFDMIEEDLDNIANDEELDMLDLAYGLTDFSRLGCQIKLHKSLEGIEITVPAAVDARGGL